MGWVDAERVTDLHDFTPKFFGGDCSRLTLLLGCGAEHDERHGQLAVVLVWDTDDAYVVHERVSEDVRLELRRGDCDI